MIKANLIHLSFNMWSDNPHPLYIEQGRENCIYNENIRFDDDFWHELVTAMKNAGFNMIIMDLGDAIQYKSHPEISINGAWSIQKLKDEIAYCKDNGIEMIPKLNFATTHDIWLGEYSRMISTQTYYTVCKDLINEVVEIFDGPRYFHLGMDEETASHQMYFQYAVMRQDKLWWHDLNLLVETVEKKDSVAWVWSDKIWHCGKEEFKNNMPLSVIQNNWYYLTTMVPDDELSKRRVDAFDELEESGYKQVPCSSNWRSPQSFKLVKRYCDNAISKDNLLGYLQTSWMPTLPEYRYQHLEAIEMVKQAFD